MRKLFTMFAILAMISVGLSSVLFAQSSTPEELYARKWTTAEMNETLAQKSVWVGNQLGISDVVPSPWIPMKVTGQTIKCLNQNFTYKNSILPVQISSLDKNLFSAPPRFRLSANSKDYTFQNAKVTIEPLSDAKVRVTSVAENSPFRLQLVTEYEYDGMATVNLTLTASNNIEVTNLYLEFPLNSEYTSLFHYTHTNKQPPNSDSGFTPEEGIQLDAFRHLIWLGNHDVGFSWFADGIKNWQLEDEKSVQVIGAEENNARVFQIKFADKNFKVAKPLEIEFGIQATPSKQRKANWRQLNNRTSLAWSWYWGDGSYYPFQDSRPEAAKAQVHMHREHGREVMPCSSISYIGDTRFHIGPFGEVDYPGLLHREYLLWANEWKFGKTPWVMPERHTATGEWYGKRNQPHGNVVRMCPASDFQDYYIWKLNEVINETDLGAIYLDQQLWICDNPSHGCDYVNYEGKTVGNAPVFAFREITKRIYTLFYLKHGKAPLIKWHCSNQLLIPAMSFIDTFWDGEAYSNPPMRVLEYYSKLLTPGRMQVQNVGKSIGFGPDFLPMFDTGLASTEASVRDLMGLMLIHDSTVWPKHTMNDSLVQWIQNKHLENLTVDMERIYYWEDNKAIQIDNNDVKYLVEYDNDKIVLILFNWSDTCAEPSVTLNLSNLISKKSCTIKDVLADRVIDTTNRGNMSVAVPARDFRMLLIQ